MISPPIWDGELRRLFDATLASDFPFAIRLPASEAPPDLTFTVTRSPPPAGGEAGALVYTSPRRLPDGTSGCTLYRLPGCERLSFPGADFWLWPDQIVCHLPDATLRHLVETYLLGPVFAYWLERQGRPVLHASAVAATGRAAAFLGPKGTGKSGMAGALLRQGAALLCDDLVPLGERGGPVILPGFPQMRMWPDEAACFLERWEHLPRVSPEADKRWVPVGPGGLGSFHGSPLPLSCLYLLDRQAGRDATVEIHPISPRDALIELLRHSFTPLLVEAAGLQPARFDRLARLVSQVSVRRLRYPSGFDLLPRVAEAVRLDLEQC